MIKRNPQVSDLQTDSAPSDDYDEKVETDTCTVSVVVRPIVRMPFSSSPIYTELDCGR